MSTVLTPAPQTETVSSPARRPAPRSGSPRRRTPADPGERRIWLILLGTLVLAAFCVGMFLQQPRFRHTDTPIGEIQLGANVPGSNPSEADDLTFGDSIDPDTWKMVRLTGLEDDGTLLELELLRPTWWIEERRVDGGDTISIRIDELGYAGEATLEGISDCPPIRPGPGQTVTGLFRHYAREVIDLRTENGEVIGVTPNHPFWSADRKEFVQAGDLKQGETLRLLDGTTTVANLTRRPIGAPVYNIEVLGSHVYYVADSGVLVHNAGSEPCKIVANSAHMSPYGGPGGGHHVPAKKAFEGAPNYDPKQALAVPNHVLKGLNVDHPVVTGAQAKLYRDFAKTGQTLTWEAIEGIETKALIAGGMEPDTALATVRQGIDYLKEIGVSGPTRIPWGGVNP